MSSGPKIVTADIESSPTLGYAWAQWQQNMTNEKIVEPTRMLCLAWKWLDEKGTHFASEHASVEATNPNNFHEVMVQSAWVVLNNCDALVTYNGDRFDIPHLYREFAEYGLGPPSPFKSIDLYRTAKRLKFFSHKLDYVADQLQVGRKLDTGGFQLWLDVMAGDAKAWAKFERYNRRDVVVTEALYKELLPWIKSPINQSLFGDGCPRCPSTKVPQKRGFRYTGVSKFQRYYCLSCKGWSSDGKRVEGAELRPVS